MLLHKYQESILIPQLEVQAVESQMKDTNFMLMDVTGENGYQVSMCENPVGFWCIFQRGAHRSFQIFHWPTMNLTINIFYFLQVVDTRDSYYKWHNTIHIHMIILICVLLYTKDLLLFYDHLKSRLQWFIHNRNQKKKCPLVVDFTAF